MRPENRKAAIGSAAVLLPLLFSLGAGFSSARRDRPAPSSARAPASTCDVLAMRWAPMPFDAQGKYRAGCEPTVLYSWLTAKDVIDTGDARWPLRRGPSAFFHRTPLATFLYGQYSYRVKLKPGVRFKIDDPNDWNAHAGCKHPEKEMKDTVYLWNDEKVGFTEYVLCSMGPVESWSFGMPEHFEEMKRERELIERLGKKNMDGFMNPSRTSERPGRSCKDCFQGYTIHDARNKGDVAALDRAFALMRASIDLREGRVYYPDSRRVRASGPEVDAHFTVSLPLPFHRDFDRSALLNGEAYASLKVQGAEAAGRDHTSAVGAFCDGKSSCGYKISRSFLAGQGAIPSFSVRWKCCDTLGGKCAPATHRISIANPDLEGVVFDFGCDSKGSARYEGGPGAPALEYASE